MSNSIEDALKKAVEKAEVGQVTEGQGAEENQELSTRIKKLMARKTNLQRKKRQKLPSSIR